MILCCYWIQSSSARLKSPGSEYACVVNDLEIHLLVMVPNLRVVTRLDEGEVEIATIVD